MKLEAELEALHLPSVASVIVIFLSLYPGYPVIMSEMAKSGWMTFLFENVLNSEKKRRDERKMMIVTVL